MRRFHCLRLGGKENPLQNDSRVGISKCATFIFKGKRKQFRTLCCLKTAKREKNGPKRLKYFLLNVCVRDKTALK